MFPGKEPNFICRPLKSITCLSAVGSFHYEPSQDWVDLCNQGDGPCRVKLDLKITH